MSEDQQTGPEQGAGGAQGVQKERPSFLTTLCILSYIGSGLGALGSLIGMFAGPYLMSMLTGGVRSAAESSEMSAEQAEAASEGIGAIAGMGSTILIVIFGVLLILNVISLIGVAKMWKLQKSGFYMYTAVNGLFFILFLIGVAIWPIIITGGFIAMYAANFKHLE